MASQALIARATMWYRASLVAAVAMLGVVGAGCAAGPNAPSKGKSAAPTVASRDQPAHRACGPGTDAATARTIDVYVAVLQHLTPPQRQLRPVQVLYVVEY